MTGVKQKKRIIILGIIKMETCEKLDYDMVLMNHLNRLSAICTSGFIDTMSQSGEYAHPQTNGERALEWGIDFLYCIIPTDMKDDEFREEYSKLSKRREEFEKDFLDKNGNERRPPSDWYDFRKLKIAIDLLNRKGMLMSNKIPARREKKQKDKITDSEMVFEE